MNCRHIASAKGEQPFPKPRNDALLTAMPFVKEKAKSFDQIIEKAHFVLVDRPLVPDEKAAKALDDVSRGILRELTPRLQTASWTRTELEDSVAALAQEHGLGLGKVAQPLRAALAGKNGQPQRIRHDCLSLAAQRHSRD